MRRHTYSTDNDYRLKTVAFLGILAYISGSWIAGAFTGIASALTDSLLSENLVPFIGWLVSPFSNLGLQPEAWVPTTGALFGIYFWAFNKHLWRWDIVQQTPLVATPDLDGKWTVHIIQTDSTGEEPDDHRTVTAYEDIGEDAIEKVSGEAQIEQSWRKLQITIDFEYSTSTSLGASFITDTATPRLHYIYRNVPNPKSDDTAQIHYGTVDLRVDVEDGVLEGEYFTDRFRKTSGQIVFRKKDNQNN